MYEAVTDHIRVRVEPEFDPEQSQPGSGHYVWLYTVEITNESDQPVRLLARYWQITDANGRTEHVRGAGVVGETPLIEPGQSFAYTSGCPLRTPSGIMVGTYQMVRDHGDRAEHFDIAIPAFSLDCPSVKRSVN